MNQSEMASKYGAIVFSNDDFELRACTDEKGLHVHAFNKNHAGNTIIPRGFIIGSNYLLKLRLTDLVKRTKVERALDELLKEPNWRTKYALDKLGGICLALGQSARGTRIELVSRINSYLDRLSKGGNP